MTGEKRTSHSSRDRAPTASTCIKKNRPKGSTINGIALRKAGELGLGNFVFFLGRSDIIKKRTGKSGGVSWIAGSASVEVYLFQLSNYNKILNQRNKTAQGDHVPPGIPGYAGRLGPPARSVRGTGHPGEGKICRPFKRDHRRNPSAPFRRTGDSGDPL